MRESKIDLQGFVQLLFEAKALTRTYQASVTKTRSDSGRLPRKNLMPYFFATLESLLHPDHRAPQPQKARRSRSARSKVRQNGDSAERAAILVSSDRVATQNVPSAPTKLAQAPDMHPVWLRALEELRNVLTPENFDTWLADTYVISEEDNSLLVAVPKPFHKDWLNNKLRGRVESVLRRLGHGDIRVEFVVVAP
jgi:hypothetical protein